MASMRTVVSVLPSAASASARVFGGSGNAGAAASVSATITKRERIMKSTLAILALFTACNAFAADTPSSSSRADPELDRYHAAADKQDWKSAAGVMREALTK